MKTVCLQHNRTSSYHKEDPSIHRPTCLCTHTHRYNRLHVLTKYTHTHIHTHTYTHTHTHMHIHNTHLQAFRTPTNGHTQTLLSYTRTTIQLPTIWGTWRQRVSTRQMRLQDRTTPWSTLVHEYPKHISPSPRVCISTTWEVPHCIEYHNSTHIYTHHKSWRPMGGGGGGRKGEI